MTRGYPAVLPCAWKRSLAAGATLFCFLYFHDALLVHAPRTRLPSECPQPCCAVSLQAGVEGRSGVQFAGSSEK